MLSSVVFFVNFIQPRVNWEEGTSVEELPSSDWPAAVFTENCLND